MTKSRSQHPPRPPVVLRLRREAVYAALMVVLLVTLAELGLRLAHARKEARRGARPYGIHSETHDGVAYGEDDGPIALANDPHLVYRPRGPHADAVVTLNRSGFRGPERPRAKPPATQRFVVLGGSTAFGMNTSGDAAPFTALLEQQLAPAAAARGRALEGWNCGVIGYDSTQELALLATDLVDVAPDVVLLFDGWNDFRGSSMVADPREALLHPKFTQNDRYLARRTAPFLEWLRGFAVVEKLDEAVAALAARAGPPRDHGDYFDHSAVALPRYERNLRALIRLARAYGAVPIVVTQPELFQRANPPAPELAMRAKREEEGYGDLARAIYPRFVAIGAALAAAEAAPYLDATRLFDGCDDVVFTDFVHLNDRGHQLVAEHLAPLLERALVEAAAGARTQR
ncbi:MAG: SGNH/GDSL hydrolase family protein [Planctomycetes bacterium]|nr:SGNH/GDSL hydrolase family protein [Planctomycetota bacterium]